MSEKEELRFWPLFGLSNDLKAAKIWREPGWVGKAIWRQNRFLAALVITSTLESKARGFMRNRAVYFGRSEQWLGFDSTKNWAKKAMKT